MPHDRNGRLVKNGDLVIHRDPNDSGSEKVMIILSITPTSDTCNASAIPIALRQKGTEHWTPIAHQLAWCITLKECDKVGDPPMMGISTAEETAVAVT